MKLAIAMYLVPFSFALRPALLLQGSPLDIAIAVLFGVASIVAISAGFVGYKTNIVQRVFLICGGALLLYPDTVADCIGGILLALALVLYSPRVSNILQRRGQV
jgi:TRAP-type uncharacterized transport system fused permease subunit